MVCVFFGMWFGVIFEAVLCVGVLGLSGVPFVGRGFWLFFGVGCCTACSSVLLGFFFFSWCVDGLSCDGGLFFLFVGFFGCWFATVLSV